MPSPARRQQRAITIRSCHQFFQGIQRAVKQIILTRMRLERTAANLPKDIFEVMGDYSNALQPYRTRGPFQAVGRAENLCQQWLARLGGWLLFQRQQITAERL